MDPDELDSWDVNTDNLVIDPLPAHQEYAADMYPQALPRIGHRTIPLQLEEFPQEFPLGGIPPGGEFPLGGIPLGGSPLGGPGGVPPGGCRPRTPAGGGSGGVHPGGCILLQNKYQKI